MPDGALAMREGVAQRVDSGRRPMVGVPSLPEVEDAGHVATADSFAASLQFVGRSDWTQCVFPVGEAGANVRQER